MTYSTNYRKNLITYWQRFYPLWQVPAGYHVHHIKPKCTFEDKDDPRIHHPSNLIALHPDDHVSIHKCRGDKFISNGLLHITNYIMSRETKRKISEGNKGNIPWNKGVTGYISDEGSAKISKTHKNNQHAKGYKLTPSQLARRSILNAGANNPNWNKKQSAETIEKIIKGNKDFWTKERRAIARAQALNRKKVSCPHCDKQATPGMYARWHGDNCKFKSLAD